MRFVGRRLGIARAFRGVSIADLAEQVVASKTLVGYIEKGERQPSGDLVEAFGEVLGFEPEFFFRPVHGEFREGECSFRKRARTRKKLQGQVLAQGTLLGELISYLRQNLDLPPLDVPNVPVRNVESAEIAAEFCRESWGLGLDSPIMTVGRVVEHAGIFLAHVQAESVEVDAFCRWGEVSMIMLSTSKDSASRTLFNIGHETGHLVMHRDLAPGDADREREADRFAAAFLLPRSGFARDFLSYRRVDWPHLFALKQRWRASVAAILHRAYELRLTDAVTYRRMYKQLYARGWHRGEPHEPIQERPELLPLAMKSMEEIYGKTPYDVANDLYWRPATLKAIASIELGEAPTPLGSEKVVSLQAYINNRKAAAQYSGKLAR